MAARSAALALGLPLGFLAACTLPNQPPPITSTTVPTSEPWGAPTTIVDTPCDLVPATTAPGEKSGGHIVCPLHHEGDPWPIPRETTPPAPGSSTGVIGGHLVDSRTGQGLPGVVVVRQLHLSVASGADGRFGLAVAPGSYTLDVIINRDITYDCPVSNPVTIAAGQTQSLNLSCTN